MKATFSGVPSRTDWPYPAGTMSGQPVSRPRPLVEVGCVAGGVFVQTDDSRVRQQALESLADAAVSRSEVAKRQGGYRPGLCRPAEGQREEDGGEDRMSSRK